MGEYETVLYEILEPYGITRENFLEQKYRILVKNVASEEPWLTRRHVYIDGKLVAIFVLTRGFVHENGRTLYREMVLMEEKLDTKSVQKV